MKLPKYYNITDVAKSDLSDVGKRKALGRLGYTDQEIDRILKGHTRAREIDSGRPIT